VHMNIYTLRSKVQIVNFFTGKAILNSHIEFSFYPPAFQS
jgi:hypothetical protein